MTQHAKGTLQIANWDEQPYEEIDDTRKLTTTKVTQKFHGDIEGDGSGFWLTAYRADGTAEFAGFQRIMATVGGIEGSVVLRTQGSYDGSVAISNWTVVEGTSTGALEAMTGTGRSEAGSDGAVTYVLDFDLG